MTLGAVACPTCRRVMELARQPTGDTLYVCRGCLSGYVVPAVVGAYNARAHVIEQERKFHELVDTRNTHRSVRSRR